MIKLECSSCLTVLSIDDAFAGGVCRCQHCGTIQTVPKLNQTGVSSAEETKALFHRKARIESALNPYNDQLDKAADEMDSSGGMSASELAGITAAPRRATAPEGESAAGVPSPRASAPRRQAASESAMGVPSPRTTRPAPAAPPTAAARRPAANSPSAKPAATPANSPGAASTTAPPARSPYMPRPSSAASEPTPEVTKSSRKPLIIGIAAGVALLGGVAAFFAFAGSKTAQSPAQAQVPDTAVPAPAPADEQQAIPAPATVAAPEPQRIVVTPASAPGICGIPLDGKTVVYVVDRAGCTQQGFGSMLEAVYASIESLTPTREFHVQVWNGNKPTSFPVASAISANGANLDACRRQLVDIYAGSSDISTALSAALSAQPTDIVLLSAVDLDQFAAEDIRNKLHSYAIQSKVRFHGVAVGSDLVGDRLRALTTEFGGQYRQRDLSSLLHATP